MRRIEGPGLGAAVPGLTRPGKEPLYRMLMTGQRYCYMNVPALPGKQYESAFGVQTCDVGGDGIQCQMATPVSALRGLGGIGKLGTVTWSNAFCRSYDNALENLQILLTEAERVGISNTVEYQQAKALIDNETSYAQWKHASPVLPETCTKETLKAEGLYSALNSAVKAAGGTRGVDVPLPSTIPTEEDTKTDKILGTVRTVAIVAGIAVAFGGVIYLVGPLVRGLSQAGAKRLR